jgi:diguanylate cyclase (GGDEF)-like protein
MPDKLITTADSQSAFSAACGRRIAAVLQGLLSVGGTVAVQWYDQTLGNGSVTLAAEPAAAGDGDEGEALSSAWDTAGGYAQVAVSLPLATGAERAMWLRQAQSLVATELDLAHAQVRISTLEKSRRLLQALYEIADVAGTDLEMTEMLRRVHAVIGTLMYAETCYIMLYDSQRDTMRFLYFADKFDPYVAEPNHEFNSEEMRTSLTFGLLRHGQPMRGPSVEVRKVLGVVPDPWHGPDSMDWLGVPMRRGDQVLGAVVVQNYETADSYDDEDRALLSYVAQHILTAVERRQTHLDMERHINERTRELLITNRELHAEILERIRAEKLHSALFRITELAMGSESLQHFYADVHVVVSELVHARNFFIALLSDDGQMLEFPYHSDENDPQPVPRKRGNGLTEYVMGQQKSLLLDHEGLDALLAQGVLYEHGSHAYSWLGVPLFSEGHVFGVVAVQSYTPEISFTPHDQNLLTFVAHHIANGLARQRAQERLREAHAELEQRVQDRTHELAEANANLVIQIEERLRAEQRLIHQATHDNLTGLPNRALLLERLAAAVTRANGNHDSDETFAILFLDLDRFKLVNDSIGHAAGDRMLIKVARRIMCEIGPDDVVARLSGDEFAVLVYCIQGGAVAAHALAERLLVTLGRPVCIDGRELFPSASIGIAAWHPRYHTGEELLRDADVAMYRAKSRGRSRCELFDEAMRGEMIRALDLDADMHRAINHGDFLPYYQPIMRLRDDAVVGHEALLRWRHENRGLLLPGEFIGLGEKSGLIEQVDWLVYQQVAAQLARGGNGYISVNVSPLHFHSADFVDRLLALLADAGADPSRLRLEITEGALLDDSPGTLSSLSALRERGVLVFLDDFGTGFSALSYLHRFPISVLKIDSSFIAGIGNVGRLENLALVRAIVALANTLGMETMAEGVETPEQLQALRELGCTYVQGNLIGIPAAVIDGVQAGAGEGASAGSAAGS